MGSERDVRAVIVGKYITKQLPHAGLDYNSTVSIAYPRGYIEP